MYQHIMVPLDGSEEAECVLPHVEAIATGCNISRLTLVRVIEPLKLPGGVESRINPEERERLEKDSVNIAEEYLNNVTKRLKDAGISAESKVLWGKDVIDELVDYADESGVDLVVIATHGRSGVSRWVWGSMADRILRSASMPVLMVRSASHADSNTQV